MHSLEHVNTLLMLGALIMLGGIVSSIAASRMGAPILLVFLLIGMLAGEDGPGRIHFNDYALAYLVGSICLSIILFDGGLRTKIARAGNAFRPALGLATLGVLITSALVGLAAHFMLKLGPVESWLLGSIVASTDAAAVFFLLRAGGLDLKPRVGAVLDVESATNDPVAVCLALILTQILTAAASQSLGTLAFEVARQALTGAILGLAGGLVLARAINRINLAAGLSPLFVVTSAAALYAVTVAMGGSGFLAVYLAGLVLGNRPIRSYPATVGFLDVLTWLCQIVMFIMLGLLVTPKTLFIYALPALGIAIFLMLVARPVAVFLCLAPFGFSWREKTFVSWVGLRGAVSIFLAAIPTLAGVPNAPAYFNIAFFVVLVSLLVQGWTILPAAERLGLALPRQGPRTTRIELDIPGQFEHELVIYPILRGSRMLRRTLLPAWARPVFVVRGDFLLSAEEAGSLQPGDYLYVLAPTARVDRLDRLFSPAPVGGGPGAPLPGEFVLNGEAPLARVASLYGLDLDAEEMTLTVAELFARRLDERPELGDHVLLGSRAMLIARKLEDNRVIRAGLHIDAIIVSMIAAARQNAEPRFRKLWARLRLAMNDWRNRGTGKG
jgi:cell volume regulation protein A